MVDNNTIDPGGMATKLATAYTRPAQSLLANQTSEANATSAALTKLQGSLSTFGGSLSTLSGKGGLAPNTAAFSDTSVGTATAGTNAVPGSYNMFVEQVAANHQIAITDLPAAMGNMGGKITLSLGNGDSIEVLVSSADTDGNGSLSYTEIARAINQASTNKGKVTAQVATVGGAQTLLLSSKVSGEDGEITLGTAPDAQGMDVDARFKSAWMAPPTQLMEPRNAVFWLGPQGSGLRIEQASNTVDAIDGLTLQLTKAQAPGSEPVTLTVAQDNATTKTNVQSFVDAYNTLRGALDGLTSAKNKGKDDGAGRASSANGGANGPDGPKPPGAQGDSGGPGPFANDASVRSLKDRMATMLRQSFNGHTLRDVGVSVDRFGKLSLDSHKLETTLDTQPEVVDAVFGQAGVGSNSGLMGAFNGVVKQWTDAASGFIKQRQESVQVAQKSLGNRQTRLDERYDQMYDRYLKQFSSLQDMQQQMSQTSAQLESLNDSSK